MESVSDDIYGSSDSEDDKVALETDGKMQKIIDEAIVAEEDEVALETDKKISEDRGAAGSEAKGAQHDKWMKKLEREPSSMTIATLSP